MPRVSLFIHEPDGDMGEAMIVGPFKTWEAAEARRDKLVEQAEAHGRNIEAIPCAMLPSRTGAGRIFEWMDA